MSFLGLAFLAALPLAAAPVLLHLFDRRRQVVIEWGAMAFLMEAATRRTRARRLKQWLLLLLRVLAIAALVLALARPMLPGNWFGRSDRGETLVVLDNSMSMQRVVDGTSQFEAAVEKVIGLLDEMPPGDSIRVLLSSPYPVWAMGASTRVDSTSRPVLAEQLRELQPTQGRSDLLSALFQAVQAEIDPTQRRRRILVFSDGQGADWTIADDVGWQRFREVLSRAPIPTQVEISDWIAAPRDKSNIAVDSVSASRTIVGLNQPLSLTAHIQNYGRASSRAATARWLVDDEEQYESHVPSLAGGEAHEVTWKHSFDETGVYSLKCQVEADDALPADNVATFVLEVVEEVPVLVLEDAPELAELQRDAFFIQAALGWFNGGLDSGNREVFVPRMVDRAQLARLPLDDYRAIVIPNLTELEADVVARLNEYVAAGGGLWIALGPRTDIDTFNQHLFADGMGLSPLAIDRVVSRSDESLGDAKEKSRSHLVPIKVDHPAMATLADADQLDTADVTVNRSYRFVPPPRGEEPSVLLELDNGEPLAVEKYVGRGRVIVLGLPLRLQWSELARSQAFVVMVQDWLGYLTQPRATRHNLLPGDPISLHVPDAESPDATLHTPHGDEIELTADSMGDGFVFRSSRTVLPGDYLIELGALGDRVPFHVNRDPLESNLAPLTTADRKLLDELSGLNQTTTDAVEAGVSFNDPLWPLLLMILIGVIAAELLLSGVIARERFGSAPIAETTEQWTEEIASFRASTPGMAATAVAPQEATSPIPRATSTDYAGTNN